MKFKIGDTVKLLSTNQLATITGWMKYSNSENYKNKLTTNSECYYYLSNHKIARPNELKLMHSNLFKKYYKYINKLKNNLFYLHFIP
jgi:hypothetical protein